MHSFKTAGGINQETGSTNLIYLNPQDKSKTEKNSYLLIGNFIFKYEFNEAVEVGSIAFNNVQRKLLNLSLNQIINSVAKSVKEYLKFLKIEVDFLAKSQSKVDYHVDELEEHIKRTLHKQVLSMNQNFAIDCKAYKVICSVKELDIFEDIPSGQQHLYGILTKDTTIQFDKTAISKINLIGQKNTATVNIFKQPNIDFNTLSIGGMNEQFKQIFRRAFTPRITPAAILDKFGIKPVKGILLYGPPGTGKTLMAREIGRLLNSVEPIIVNGPEILNKYVGESENNIRKLFKPAEDEWAASGASSNLHIIVLDELDAICKKRGETQGNMGDTVVNQILSKMDGYHQQNNILLIGMTNRKDMIDEALLRPGRFEVHIEISLPDEEGRLQILKIHTATMEKSGVLDHEISLESIADKTKNYTGAELMSLVQNAGTFALNRNIDISNISQNMNIDQFKVTAEDFDKAFKEIKPAFGVSETKLERFLGNGIWGNINDDIRHDMLNTLNTFKTATFSSLTKILIKGSSGTGKSAVASYLGKNSGYPYISFISPEDFVGSSDTYKINTIINSFETAYKSPLSLIILDDIDRLLNYTSFNHSFSNIVLQAIITLLKKNPPIGHKLFIISTADIDDDKTIFDVCKLGLLFNEQYTLPMISSQTIITVLYKMIEMKEKLNIFSEYINANTVDQFKKDNSLSMPHVVSIKRLIMFIEQYNIPNDGVQLKEYIYRLI